MTLVRWLYFASNYNRVLDRDVNFHEKDYVKDFIKHNLDYCEEAKDFYIPEITTYACKDCMKIAQDYIKQNQDTV